MSNVFVVRPIRAGLGYTSTDKLLQAITSVSVAFKGHPNLTMYHALDKDTSAGEHVTEVFKLRVDRKYVEDVSFVFLMGPEPSAAFHDHYDKLLAEAFSPSAYWMEHADPISLMIVGALRQTIAKFRTPCTKIEHSENCVMLEIRNAMDESL
jgi:hypothetical protein